MTTDGFLRVTVAGRSRSLDAVLPEDASPAALMPELLAMLEEHGRADAGGEATDAPVAIPDASAGAPTNVGSEDVARLGLFTDTGHMLPPHIPLSESGLADGRRLTIRATADAPPEPVVHDLVDRIVGTRVRGLWGPGSRTAVAAPLAGCLLLLVVWLLQGTVTMPWLLPALMTFTAILAWALRARAAAWTLLTTAGIAGAVDILSSDLEPRTTLLWLGGLVITLMLTAGLLAGRVRAAAGGTLVLILLGGTAFLAELLTDSARYAAAVTAVVALIVLGVLPRAAMSLSGLYQMDDGVADGRSVPVRSAENVIAETYYTLAAAVVVTSVVEGIALVVLARDVLYDGWGIALFVLVSLAFALRALHVPLAVLRLVIWVAVLAGVSAVVLHVVAEWPEYLWFVVVGCVIVALLLMVPPYLVRTSPLQEARARRRAATLESVAMLATIPVLVGLFGVYADLWRTF